MHDYAAIARLHRSERLSIRDTARHMGISRNTVRRALRTAPEADAIPPDIEMSSGWLAGTIELPDGGGTVTIEIGAGLTPLELLTRLGEFADEQRPQRGTHETDPATES